MCSGESGLCYWYPEKAETGNFYVEVSITTMFMSHIM